LEKTTKELLEGYFNKAQKKLEVSKKLLRSKKTMKTPYRGLIMLYIMALRDFFYQKVIRLIPIKEL